jgi:transcriptional regulator with XRE-family HTH domain
MLMEMADPQNRPLVDPLELATRVKAKRKAEKMSLRAAGQALGMSAATLSRVETGDHLPERDHLLRLASWAGLSLDAPIGNHRKEQIHSDDASTVEAIELHLRADKNLDSKDADILVNLMHTAYEQMSSRE